MEWVDGNLGSRLTMKYPAVWLMEPGAHGEVLSIAFAAVAQDAGAKIIHVAPDTTSTIVSKSISKGGDGPVIAASFGSSRAPRTPSHSCAATP